MRKTKQLEKKFRSDNRNRYFSESNDDFNNSIVCYKCRHTGHIARGLYFKKKKKKIINNLTFEIFFKIIKIVHMYLWLRVIQITTQQIRKYVLRATKLVTSVGTVLN